MTRREQYGALSLASPDLLAELVDHERASRGEDTREVLVAYQVVDGHNSCVLMLG